MSKAPTRMVVEIPRNNAGLGAEHPHCDQIQLIMIILFFILWGGDFVSFLIFGYSTVLVGLWLLPVLLLPALFSLGCGLYLIVISHQAVFGGTTDLPRLIDFSVYSRVRHPMYLGILLFCLGFFFMIPSLLSFGGWLVFFILYDRITTYEEQDLIHILGEKYVGYQKRVPKWLPRV